MNEQRRLDLALLREDELKDLIASVAHRARAARDQGLDVADDLLELQVALLVERALRRQESSYSILADGLDV